MDKRILVIANPVAGRAKRKYWGLLKEKLMRDAIPFDWYDTTPEKNGTKTIKEGLSEAHSDIIVIGGDGTLNEVINGLERDIPVGLLPCGSGNDYSKCLLLGSSKDEVVDTAISGNIHQVDVGLCNERKFLNGVGVGFDGQIVADMIKKPTWLQGASKYYWHVLTILASYTPRNFSIQKEKEETQKPLILCCIAKGTTFGGGFRLTPQGQLDDGLLSICEIGNLSGFRRFLNIHLLQKGNHNRLEEVKLSQEKQVKIYENNLLEAHIDGEYFGHPPLHCSVLEKALKIRAISLR